MTLSAGFFTSVRKSLFSGSLSQSQVDGFNVIDAEWTKEGSADNQQYAYVLATVYHECAKTMQPITEYGSASYLKAKPYWPYIGRGYVQLTWQSNYAKADEKLGLGNELVADPDKALEPDIAARVLVRGMREGWFTGDKLADFFSPTKCDFVGARGIINGTDRATLIAGYAIKFLAALKGATT
jgi:predicted chitinase